MVCLAPMRPHVIDIKEFYDSRLGAISRRQILLALRRLWPSTLGDVICGLGYATPYLAPFREGAERVFAVMPAAQGGAPWPPDGPRRIAIADEIDLPFGDNSVDRMLLVHAVEHSDVLDEMLNEVWRVLRPEGRLVVVAPNRRGLWARAESTPFGQGRPFSASQLSRLLRDVGFAPQSNTVALFMPPSQSRVILRAATMWRGVMRRIAHPFGGVVMVEASKQVMAARPTRRVRRQRVFVPSREGAVAATGAAREAARQA